MAYFIEINFGSTFSFRLRSFAAWREDCAAYSIVVFELTVFLLYGTTGSNVPFLLLAFPEFRFCIQRKSACFMDLWAQFIDLWQHVIVSGSPVQIPRAPLVSGRTCGTHFWCSLSVLLISDWTSGLFRGV